MKPLCIRLNVGAPGFEPGVTRSQSEHVSRYTTPRYRLAVPIQYLILLLFSIKICVCVLDQVEYPILEVDQCQIYLDMFLCNVIRETVDLNGLEEPA